MPIKKYDLVVIGAGAAGEKGAVTAGYFGKKVALIEKHSRVGGAMANTGTLPSKTLRETALALSGLKARRLYGVDLSLRREVTVADLMYHEEQVTDHERKRMLGNFYHYNVDLYRGAASFVDPHTVRVATDPIDQGKSADNHKDELLYAEKILIATGSSPYRPPEFQFDDFRIHDSDEILELEKIPHSLAVIGAGVIGSEYACTFAALGTAIHLIDSKEILLPFLDQEISSLLGNAMVNLEIQLHLKEKVIRCVPTNSGPIELHLASGKVLNVDQVLVTSGRTSNTAALNLGAAGLTAGERGFIEVDTQFRTKVPHIYAAGDVIGFPALASTSNEQARVAICHAFDLGFKSEVSPILPYGIYTIPEVSMVGATEESLRKDKIDYIAGKAFYGQNPRGRIIGDTTGLLKLLFRRVDMKLLGVHAIGEQASELVHIGLIALLTGSDADLFNRACFNYPTLGDLYKMATYFAMAERRNKVCE